MTSRPPAEDRRQHPRIDATEIAVVLRPRGRLGAISAQAVDFNRHGIAVHTHTSLTKDRLVYLSLQCGCLHLENLVGVVHNCVRQGGRYRSGILFRPTSQLQHDQRQVEEVLACIESSLLQSREQSA